MRLVRNKSNICSAENFLRGNTAYHSYTTLLPQNNCSCTLSTTPNDNFTLMNQRSIIIFKKQFTAAFTKYCCPWKHSSNKRSLENFTAWNKLEKWNVLSINPHHLQLHFSCCSSKTLYNINMSAFKKISVGWNVGLPLHVPNFKIFLTLSIFEWVCFSWPKFDLGYWNLPKCL